MVELKILSFYRNCVKRKKDNVTAWLVPGSHVVEAQIKRRRIIRHSTNLDLYCANPVVQFLG
jgi:hypothetical protein